MVTRGAAQLTLLLVVSVVAAAQKAQISNVPWDESLPGMKVALTNRGLTYAAAEGRSYLQNRLNGTSIQVPSQSGEKDTIEWTISNIQIRDMKVPDLTAQFVAGRGLSLAVRDISAQVTADWSGREKVWPHPSGSGHAQVDVSSVSGTVDVQVIAANGRPLVKDLSTAISIGGFDLHFSGSHLDFLLNLLKGLFSGKIRDAVQSAIENAISDEINHGMNGILQSLPDTLLVSPSILLNYSLVSNELFTPSAMTLSSSGSFNNVDHPWQFPFSAGPLPDIINQTSPSMLQVVVSEYVLNTAAYTFFKSGLLNVVIDSSMVPPQSPIQLNTSSWGALVPQLPKLYPNWAMEVNIYATSVPSLEITSAQGLQLRATGAIDVRVVSPKNNTVMPAFVMAFNSTAAGEASVSVGGNLTGQLTAFSIDFWLARSVIGPFDPTALTQFLTFAVEGIGLPYLNSVLSRGFPLPSSNTVRLVSPQTGYGKGYLYVLTDIQANTWSFP